MARLCSRIKLIRCLVFGALLVGAALLVGDSSSPKYTKHDRGYWARQDQLSFVRPGIILKISAVTIGSDGTVKARFKITDPRGVPLDREGITTPGPVTARFMIAFLGKGVRRYLSYNKNATTGRPTTDANGTFEKVGDGEYIYTFTTKLPANYEKDVTTTVGGQASRNLAEFEMGSQADNDVFHFRPDGQKVTETRDIVRTATCNSTCHDPLSVHGSRRKIEYCILCHQPELYNATTGNNSDFPVMVHRLHMGSRLPSVIGGKPYAYGNTDYSKVSMPSDVRNCEVCHDAKSGAAQADAWLTRPSRAACGSCHDDVNFATGEGHLDLPQVSDNQCATCHVPQGEVEYDASIRGAHLDTRLTNAMLGIQFEAISVADGVAGKRPTVVFQIRDKNGNSIPPSSMDRFNLVLAGPSTDYTTYVSEVARTAQGPAGGPYFWTFANPLPADAKGTYVVGMEGYKFVKILPGTKKELQVRDAGQNKHIYFSVDGSKLTPRRQAVTIEKCNQCHFKLEAHGRNRNTIEECVLCHNPNKTETGRPAAAGQQASISMERMIHGIHAAEMREGGYVLYGGSGTKYDYSEVVYPGDLRNCQKCHVNGSEQASNMPATASAVNDPNAPVSPVAPITAACTACHNSVVSYSHALASTNAVGESCAACHGAGGDFSVDRVHAR
jgi:OmcA/MtrC family decaheme c-type cytochrome